MSTEAFRVLRRLFPGAEVIQSPGSDTELYGGAYTEPPSIQVAPVLEGAALRAHAVEGAPEAVFSGFVDGVQQVRVLSHQHGIPIITATVSAVVRTRRARRFVTWEGHAPIVRRGMYVPLVHLPVPAGSSEPYALVDTSAKGGNGAMVSRHPAELRAVALDRIRDTREAAERELAEAWCARHGDSLAGQLYVDGSISGSRMLATSPCAVGVVKSHNRLYADGAALDMIMGLRRGERSSVFRVQSGNSRETQPAVASWYLRLRDPRGQDAMFGLVRVEVADVAMPDAAAYAARANTVSRWILAETAPLALPDERWDKMMYGIRDCESFLRAIA